MKNKVVIAILVIIVASLALLPMKRSNELDIINTSSDIAFDTNTFSVSDNSSLTENFYLQKFNAEINDQKKDIRSNKKDVSISSFSITNTEETEEYTEDNEFVVYDNPLSEDLQRHIFELSERFNFSYELILAIIEVESNYDPSNTNGVDYGLMQLNDGRPSTLKWLKGIAKDEFGIDDFDWKNPYHNSNVGIWYLNYLRDLWIEKYKDISDEDLFALTLLAYNKGFGNAEKYIKNHSPYDWRYVKAVSKVKERIETEG